jgi:cytochrome c-type biogenesis protein CcmH/NrfF
VPDWLAWLLPVPVATLGAAVWVAWRGRPRRPADPLDSVAAHERWRRALRGPDDGPPPGRSRRSPRS